MRGDMMVELVDVSRIEQLLARIDPTGLIEDGYVAFSKGLVVVPPVGEMIFDGRNGDSHIKYGFVRDDDIFVVKVSNYFPDNARFGRPADDGAILVFDQRTGALRTVLADEGRLTQVRTAIAGAIAARHLAPRQVSAIGIIGTGSQARLQLQHLAKVTACRDVLVYGRDPARADAYRRAMEPFGFSVRIAPDPATVAAHCNLIVTTTPASESLLRAEDIRPGTHVTAMGSDSEGKRELDPQILGIADIVAVDSRAHASRIGELHHALAAGVAFKADVVELGEVIADPARGRTSDEQRTVADLVGLAVQDIQIAKAICSEI